MSSWVWGFLWNPTLPPSCRRVQSTHRRTSHLESPESTNWLKKVSLTKWIVLPILKGPSCRGAEHLCIHFVSNVDIDNGPLSNSSPTMRWAIYLSHWSGNNLPGLLSLRRQRSLNSSPKIFEVCKFKYINVLWWSGTTFDRAPAVLNNFSNLTNSSKRLKRQLLV